MKDSYTHEQLLQDNVTAESLNSLTDIALPNMSPTHVSDIITVAVTQSDDLELRGKVCIKFSSCYLSVRVAIYL